MAVIVARPGADVTEEQVITFLKARLASFKVPKHVAFVESLPKNRTGKVLKRVLRQQFAHIDA